MVGGLQMSAHTAAGPGSGLEGRSRKQQELFFRLLHLSHQAKQNSSVRKGPKPENLGVAAIALPGFC